METMNTYYSPYIGENGNWYVSNEDTGVKAQGPAGPQGPIGSKGETGERGAVGPQGEKGDTPTLVANLSETTAGKALDATMGKVLNDKAVEVNQKLDNKQNIDTAINISNIGSQSVNYANVAGTVAWNNVSGKPSLSSAVTTVKTDAKQVTINASSILSIDLPYTTPSGYLPLGVVGVNANGASCAITRFHIIDNNVRIELRNITSGQQTVSIHAIVLLKYNH